MVTEAGRELLRNTINNAKFHNRILEENEMWKQFELERGLTMMVSDDAILERAKRHQHQCSKHRRRSRSNSREHIEKRDISAAGSSKDLDRWDHNGFKELYPEKVVNSPKWDHSGFLELYPEEANNPRNVVPKIKEHPKKHKKKKRKSAEVSTSDTEIWEEFKTFKRKKCKKSKKKSESSSKTYDNHVKEWQEQIKQYSRSSPS